jgi:alkylhydroperoxidase family enzyme
MRIELISAESAPPDVKRIFQALAPDGEPSPFYRVLAHKPAVLRAYTQLSGALWAEDSALDPKLKDLAYLCASILNGCEY